jgi:hypothetical protein
MTGPKSRMIELPDVVTFAATAQVRPSGAIQRPVASAGQVVGPGGGLVDQ